MSQIKRYSLPATQEQREAAQVALLAARAHMTIGIVPKPDGESEIIVHRREDCQISPHVQARLELLITSILQLEIK